MKPWSIALVLVVAGCGSAPPPAPVPTTTTTTTAPTVTTTYPRKDTPRKLAGVDPCRLLEAADFDEPLYGKPQPYPDLPNSCTYRVGSGADNDLIVVVATAGRYQKEGLELLLDGHSMDVSCSRVDKIVECATTVAVSTDETVKVIAQLKGGNTDQVASISQDRARKALKRLPQ